MLKRPKPLVLVVDDESEIRLILRKFLEFLGYDVEEAGSGEDALNTALSIRPDAILLDHRLPDVEGVETYRNMTRAGLKIPTALMSGLPEFEFDTDSSEICRFLPKPISFDNLGEFMEQLLAESP